MPAEVVDDELVAQTSEGAQEMPTRRGMGAKELLRELGAVLRMSEAEAEAAAEPDDEDETMIINMGPQHPSTHGVLRLMLELSGETVLRCKPVMGYLHTGMEKTGEDLTFLQGGTNVTRMDYASPIFNELAFCLAAEELLDEHFAVESASPALTIALNEALERLAQTHPRAVRAYQLREYGGYGYDEILELMSREYRTKALLAADLTLVRKLLVKLLRSVD